MGELMILEFLLIVEFLAAYLTLQLLFNVVLFSVHVVIIITIKFFVALFTLIQLMLIIIMSIELLSNAKCLTTAFFSLILFHGAVVHPSFIMFELLVAVATSVRGFLVVLVSEVRQDVLCLESSSTDATLSSTVLLNRILNSRQIWMCFLVVNSRTLG